ncbi:MAG: hypothetical protein GYB31_09825 [Bacteroidetes bacterium]|nr:hypothetical protein [Bacteroidota bacterium]
MKIKKLLLAAAIILGGLSLSSCNRGYGCPTFSLNDSVVKMVTQVAAGAMQLPNK